MNCAQCESIMYEDFAADVTEYAKGLIIIRNVPCFKCSECGEVFYSFSVVKKIETMVDSLKNLSSEILVIEFAAQAA